MNNIKHTKKGFTMLFAVLVSSLLLSIGVAILDLTLKEFALSSAGRSSQFAFYAADDALECALYWDTHNLNPSATSTESSFATSTDSHYYDLISCHGSTASNDPVNPVPGWGTLVIPLSIESLPDGTIQAITSFWTTYDSTVDTPCAHVTVTKITDPVEGLTATTIDSRGYDNCDPTNPFRTERGLQALF